MESGVIFNLGEQQLDWLSRKLLHDTSRRALHTYVFPHSIVIELSCDDTLRPNELVLSYEAVRLPHTVNIIKERTSTTLRANMRRNRCRKRGG